MIVYIDAVEHASRVTQQFDFAFELVADILEQGNVAVHVAIEHDARGAQFLVFERLSDRRYLVDDGYTYLDIREVKVNQGDEPGDGHRGRSYADSVERVKNLQHFVSVRLGDRHRQQF